ncbi:MAG: multiple sugar transport system substrate-binding protein, partial [Kribbellaceae bacterium]|nr:multiple sugar transport system substrate-binding protein [Kribbellaceae bacterium]
MRTSHRLVVATAAVAAASLLLAACGGSDKTGASSQPVGSPDAVKAALEKGGTITYWSWTPSAEAQVKAFEQEYPNVKVNYVNAGTGNDQYTKLQNVIKAGS